MVPGNALTVHHEQANNPSRDTREEGQATSKHSDSDSKQAGDGTMTATHPRNANNVTQHTVPALSTAPTVLR